MILRKWVVSLLWIVVAVASTVWLEQVVSGEWYSVPVNVSLWLVVVFSAFAAGWLGFEEE